MFLQACEGTKKKLNSNIFSLRLKALGLKPGSEAKSL
jgi:hypothetical protein